MRGHRGEKLAPAAALALYLVLLGMLLAMAGFGGTLYSRIAAARAANEGTRAALSYVAAHLRAADSEDAVSVAVGPQGDALILRDEAGYETRIYLYDGTLREEYAEPDAPFAPEEAQTVAQTSRFAVARQGSVFTVTADQGTVRVALHTAQEGS